MDKKNAIKHEFNAIRCILNDWDPIGHTPEDEYDGLAHRLISLRHNTKTKGHIEQLIEKELRGYISLRLDEAKLRSTIEKIRTFWNDHEQ